MKIDELGGLVLLHHMDEDLHLDGWRLVLQGTDVMKGPMHEYQHTVLLCFVLGPTLPITPNTVKV